MELLVSRTVLLGILLVSGLAGQTYSLADDSAGLSATIKTTRAPNGVISIRPVCCSNKSILIVYSLSVIKFGKGGQSISRQTGRASLQPSLPVTLCNVSLSLSTNSKCRILLKIIHSDRVILQKDVWLFNPDEHGPI